MGRERGGGRDSERRMVRAIIVAYLPQIHILHCVTYTSANAHMHTHLMFPCLCTVADLLYSIALFNVTQQAKSSIFTLHMPYATHFVNIIVCRIDTMQCIQQQHHSTATVIIVQLCDQNKKTSRIYVSLQKCNICSQVSTQVQLGDHYHQ